MVAAHVVKEKILKDRPGLSSHIMNFRTLILTTLSALFLSVKAAEGGERYTGIFDEIVGDINDDVIASVVPTEVAPFVYGMRVRPSVEVINKVLARNIFNVNAFDGYGLCSLSYALDHEDYAAADALIAAGADVNAFSFSTIIVIMAQKNGVDEEQKLRTINYLLEHGADPKATGESGNSALAAAAYCGNTKLVKFFLDLGLDINYRDARGLTALIKAAQSCWSNIETVKMLLSNGADMSLKDVNGLNAVQAALLDAAFDRKFEKAEYLLQQNVGVALALEVDKDGKTVQQILERYDYDGRMVAAVNAILAKYID